MSAYTYDYTLEELRQFIDNQQLVSQLRQPISRQPQPRPHSGPARRDIIYPTPVHVHSQPQPQPQPQPIPRREHVDTISRMSEIVSNEVSVKELRQKLASEKQTVANLLSKYTEAVKIINNQKRTLAEQHSLICSLQKKVKAYRNANNAKNVLNRMSRRR